MKEYEEGQEHVQISRAPLYHLCVHKFRKKAALTMASPELLMRGACPYVCCLIADVECCGLCRRVRDLRADG